MSSLTQQFQIQIIREIISHQDIFFLKGPNFFWTLYLTHNMQVPFFEVVVGISGTFFFVHVSLLKSLSFLLFLLEEIVFYCILFKFVVLFVIYNKNLNNYPIKYVDHCGLF